MASSNQFLWPRISGPFVTKRSEKALFLAFEVILDTDIAEVQLLRIRVLSDADVNVDLNCPRTFALGSQENFGWAHVAARL